MDNSLSGSNPSLIGTSGDSLREAFGKALVELHEQYKDFIVLDADVAGGTGAHHFRAQCPDRFFQFGIAEQNMLSSAGGLASVGLIPVVTTFAVFHLRAIEQVRLSIAYPKRNVKIVGSHPGLDVGPDGASAQCLEDIAMFRSIPNMTVISPADASEVSQATKAIIEFQGPVYMRTGRSPAPRILGENYKFEIGKGVILREGKDATIVACGVETARALEAAEILAARAIDVRVVNMSTIKPIDHMLLVNCSEETGCIVTAEDHNVIGGLGGAVAESIAAHRPCPVEFVGVKDTFGESGEPDALAAKFGLTASYIAASVEKAIARKRV